MAVFLYLWWLGTLIFNLVFVWHCYVWHAKSLEVLHDHFKNNLEEKKAEKAEAAAQQK